MTKLKLTLVGLSAAVLVGLAALAQGDNGNWLWLEREHPGQGISHEPERTVPSYGVVYYVNPVTKGMAFYFSYGLEPGHRYLLEVTSDAVNYRAVHEIDTFGEDEEIYFTYNVSTSDGPWPRVVEIE